MRYVLSITAICLSAFAAGVEPVPSPATRPTTAPASADESMVNPAATEFLRAVGAAEDERAYKLTTAGYRKAHSPERFKQATDKLRAELNLAGRTPLQVFVAPPQPAGVERPRQAAAVTPRLAAQTDGRRIALGLTLSFEDGAWLVAGAELLEANAAGGGAAFLNAFTKAHPGARPAAFAAPGMASVFGRVTKLDAKTLTVAPTTRRGADNAPPAAERTFTIDENTRVFVLAPQSERRTATGQTVRTERAFPGKASDLKVGQEVTVETPPGESRVTRITLRRPDDAGGPGL